MSPADARELLGFHSGRDERTADPRWEKGFLGMLRPYRGLVERNFHEVMATLAVLSAELREDKVSRDVINDLWAICHLGRTWGVHAEGMLRRNQLITDDDVARLEEWIGTISYAVMLLLEGVPATDRRELAYSPPPEWEPLWPSAD